MQNAKRFAIIGGITIAVLLIAGFVLAAFFNALLGVLYVTLIILAAFSLMSTALLIYSLIVLIRTIQTVNDELKPLLASLQETVSIVKETAKAAGQTATTIGSTAQLTREFALGPSVRAVAGLVAGQQVLRVFFGRGHAGRRADQRRREQMEYMNGAVGGE